MVELKGKKFRNVVVERVFKKDSKLIVLVKSIKIFSGLYFFEVSIGFVYFVYCLYEDFVGVFVEFLIFIFEGKF